MLEVQNLHHVLNLPDYPDSSENGIAYIINTTGSTDIEEEAISNVSYFIMHYQCITNVLSFNSALLT